MSNQRCNCQRILIKYEVILAVIMKKRTLNVDWKAVDGAAVKKRVLHLSENDEGKFMCPVQTCLHDGFESSRGLRKHINTLHAWYYHFDEQPRIYRKDAARLPTRKLKSSTHKMAAFSMENGVGKDFLDWLTTPCGGGKVHSEAIQCGRRAMKFLRQAMGDTTTNDVVQEDYVDCCVGSPSIIIKFMQTLSDEWDLSSSGALNYLKAVSDLMDFRKASGVTDNVLRSFAAAEVYIRRGKDNLSKQKKLDYARNLNLESLISRNSWASIEEMEQVIPYHTPKFEHLLKRCRSKEELTVSDLAFSTRFIITFLFLRVKCTRPMSYKFLTLTMLDNARINGGYVDQTAFKTHDTYGFDTLILSDSVLNILDNYIKVLRPLMHPTCEYVLVTTNGTQYTALGTAMSLLVHQAIGKYVNPTTYRMIVETESAAKLTPAEVESVSKDQKHSSKTARRVYQKQLSREVAKEGLTCLQKLVGSGRDEHTVALAKLLDNDADVADCFEDSESHSNDASYQSTDDVTILSEKAACDVAAAVEDILEGREDCAVPSTTAYNPSLPNDLRNLQTSSETSTVVSSSSYKVFHQEVEPKPPKVSPMDPDRNEQMDVNGMEIEIKDEEVERELAAGIRLMRFTPDEDQALKEGIKRYGLGHWAKILKDESFLFHSSRTRDTLRVRADTLGWTNSKKKSKRRKSIGKK